jgi:hypothetical protein
VLRVYFDIFFTISRKSFAKIAIFLTLISLGFAPNLAAGEGPVAEQRIRVEERPNGYRAWVFSDGDRSWDVGGLSEAAIQLHEEVDLNKDGLLDVILKEGWDDGWDIFVYLQEDNSHRLVLSFPQDVPEIKYASAESQVDIIATTEDQPLQLVLYGSREYLGEFMIDSVLPYLFSLKDGRYRDGPISCSPSLVREFEFRLQSEITRLQTSADDWKRRQSPTIARNTLRVVDGLRSELDRINKPCR